MVVTSDEAHARAVRALRSWGGDDRRSPPQAGFNYRMEALQGAILRVKLRHLPTWTAARRRIAAAYDRALAPTGVTVPAAGPDVRPVYHCYAVETPRRDVLRRALEAEGIGDRAALPGADTPAGLLRRSRRPGRRPSPRRGGRRPHAEPAHLPRAAAGRAAAGGRDRGAGLPGVTLAMGSNACPVSRGTDARLSESRSGCPRPTGRGPSRPRLGRFVVAPVVLADAPPEEPTAERTQPPQHVVHVAQVGQLDEVPVGVPGRRTGCGRGATARAG